MGLGTAKRRFFAKRRVAKDAKQNGLRLSGERVVAGMATMPTRTQTFDRAFSSIIRQVDRLYLYLDGHDNVPEIARNDPRVVPIFAHEYPGLHANGKLLGLVLESEPCLYAALDDDLHFYRDYIVTMRQALAQYNDRAVVGLHGTILDRPLEDYYVNPTWRGKYRSKLKSDAEVDILGTGAVLFSSSVLQIDVRDWPKVSMTDLGLAIAAAKASIPMISIARKSYLTYDLQVSQADSLTVARNKDSSRQTNLGRELISLRDGNLA